MGESRVIQVSQEEWGNTESMDTISVYNYNRVDLTQYWKEEGLGYIYQALLICDIVDQYTSNSSWIACTGAMKLKYERKITKG